MTNAKTITANTVEPTAAAALWRIALSEYEAATTAFERLDAEHREAQATYRAEIGEPNPDFETYGVGKASNRVRLNRLDHVRSVETVVAMVDFKGRSDLTETDFAAIASKAARLVDAFEEHCVNAEKAGERILDAVEKRWEGALETLWAKRRALLATPAPDSAAMLRKLDLLAAYMTEGDDEQAGGVAAIRDDAHRLFEAA
jgi:hypothetical protein